MALLRTLRPKLSALAQKPYTVPYPAVSDKVRHNAIISVSGYNYKYYLEHYEQYCKNHNPNITVEHRPFLRIPNIHEIGMLVFYNMWDDNSFSYAVCMQKWYPHNTILCANMITHYKEAPRHVFKSSPRFKTSIIHAREKFVNHDDYVKNLQMPLRDLLINSNTD